MFTKHLRIILTLCYVFFLVLGSSGIIPVGQIATVQAAGDDTASLAAASVAPPEGSTPLQQSIPSCPNDPNSIGVAVSSIEVPSGSGNVIIPPAPGNPPDVTPGQSVTFTIAVENTHASATLTNVDAALTINAVGNPSGGTPVNIFAFTWTWPDSNNPGRLLPTEIATATAQYVVQATDPQFTYYLLRAWGEYGAGPTTTCDQNSSWGTAYPNNTPGPFEVLGPSVVVDLQGPAGGIEAGSDITWNVTVTNQRSYATTLVAAHDLYYTGSQPTSLCNPGGTNNLLGLFSSTSLAAAGQPGDSATASFACQMEESYPDPVVNTITITAEAASIQADFVDSATTDKLTPSITVVKTADVTAAGPGDIITYTITVTNDGDVPLSNVTVVDTLVGLIPNFSTHFDPGDMESVNIPYTMLETDPDPLINIVTVLGASPQGNSVGANWSVSVDKVNPAIRLDMSVNPTSQLPGSPVTYTFTVVNTSEVETLTGLQVTFPLCQQPGAGAGCTGNRVNMDSTSILPGEFATGTFVYTIQPADPDPFGFTSNTTATARAVTTGGTNVSDSNSVFVDILDSELQVTKTADRETAVRGATITYTITARNLSASPLTVTSINDSLLGPVGVIPTVLQPAGQAGDAYTFTVQYTVSGSDPDPLINIVTVTATGASGTVDDSTSEVVDISDAQLFITLTSDATINPDTGQPEVAPGNTLNFGVFVANTGLVTMSEITGWWKIVGTTMDEAQFELDFPNDQTGPTLLPGALAPFESASNNSAFDHLVTTDDPDPLRIQVRIEGEDDQGAIRNFYGVLTIDILPAAIRVIKTANATTAAVGDTITYDFVVENITDEIITAIQLVDDICGEDPISETGSGTGCWGAADQVALNGSVTPIELAPGETATGFYNYIVEAEDLQREDAILENTAVVSGLLTDGLTQVGDAASWQIEIINPLDIVKTANRSVAVPGDEVIYTFTVTNLGELSTITGLVINDTHLGEVGTRANLAPGEVWSFDVPYTVLPGDEPGISNTATVTGTVNGQNVSANDTWQLEVTDPIIITKIDDLTAVGWPVAIGDTLTYTINVVNVSSDPLTFNQAYDRNNGHDPSPRDYTQQLIDHSDDGQDNVLQPGESSWVEYDYQIRVSDPYYPALFT
ncbi:MAG: DUF11 domain-containing protein, partial [Anaerolineae bacterium]|nr:DUF11 domain-containing protein [Anaerolineae bacterium]